MFVLIINTSYKEKPPYFENKTVDKRFGANLKKQFFANFCTKFVTFLHFFSFFAQQLLKMIISTSFWGAQHPNAGQNIQLLLNNEKIIHKIDSSHCTNVSKKIFVNLVKRSYKLGECCFIVNMSLIMPLYMYHC